MTRYETPAFDPAIAFSWTLRSEEIASRWRRRSQDRQADRKTFARETGGATPFSAQAPCYATPAFAPGSAFSWTLRSAEIARRQSRPLDSKPSLTQPHVLVAA